MDRKPLTPTSVRDVIFDKAPLGKRGYHETQVDDFLDRIEAALAGADALTAEDVRATVFEHAPLIKRGYHEQQVDNFLDTVVGELEYREHNGSGDTTPAEETAPMLFTLPDEPAEPVPAERVTPPAEVLTFPLPPAPPGTRGYRPGDVERLANLLARALTCAADQEDTGTPTATDIANAKLSRTYFIGQGYHTEVLDALHAAWVDELRRRES